jgi:hypothetical protein
MCFWSCWSEDQRFVLEFDVAETRDYGPESGAHAKGRSFVELSLFTCFVMSLEVPCRQVQVVLGNPANVPANVSVKMLVRQMFRSGKCFSPSNVSVRQMFPSLRKVSGKSCCESREAPIDVPIASVNEAAIPGARGHTGTRGNVGCRDSRVHG